jgi:hypothetical protein
MTSERTPPYDVEEQHNSYRKRRKSILSNYNRRTYNKETVSERSFGPFIVLAFMVPNRTN